jgi:NitT/TauT family transport system ATP-binding protein
MQLELLRIWATHRKTMLLITHQIDEAVFLASTIYVMSRRPATISSVVEVPFGAQRDLTLKRTPEFTAIVERVWDLIEADAREAMVDTAQG